MKKLKEAVIYFYDKPETVIQLGKRKWRILDEGKNFLSFLENGLKVLRSEEQEFYDFLVKEGLVIKKQVYPRDRFLRNRFYFENMSNNLDNNFQEKIFKKRVVIIGLGGVGTVVLYNLVAMGVKSFVLIDGDDVEESNLNRQLYFEPSDIGKSKVKVLREKLNKYDETIEVDIVEKFITSLEEIGPIYQKNFDLLINAADKPANLNVLLLQKATNKNMNVITGGVGLHSGYYTSIISSDYIEDALEFFINRDSGKNFPTLKGSISPTNMLIGAMISNEILKYWMEPNLLFPEVRYVDFTINKIESESISYEDRH